MIEQALLTIVSLDELEVERTMKKRGGKKMLLLFLCRIEQFDLRSRDQKNRVMSV
jgi:hypothetical protein